MKLFRKVLLFIIPLTLLELIIFIVQSDDVEQVNQSWAY
jgi:hypothetical protein